MSEHDRARHELLARLEEILGIDQAATLMQNLPPQSWSELATKKDVGVLKADVGVLKADVGVLKADVGVLKADVGVLKADVGLLKADVGVLKADVGVLKADVGVLQTDVGVLQTDVGVLKADVEFLKSDVSGLRIDLDGLRTEMRAGFKHLGEVLDLRLSGQEARLEGFVRERFDAQTKLLVFALIGTLLTAAGIMVAAVAS